MLLQKATEDLCARLHEDEIWNANTSHKGLRPSLHWDYEPQLPEMGTPRTPWETLLNLVLADAQERFAYKEKIKHFYRGMLLPASHSHNSGVEPLSSLSNHLGAQGGVSLLPITEGATLVVQGSMQAQRTAGCPQRVSTSHTHPCSFCSSSCCVKSRLSQ